MILSLCSHVIFGAIMKKSMYPDDVNDSLRDVSTLSSGRLGIGSRCGFSISATLITAVVFNNVLRRVYF